MYFFLSNEFLFYHILPKKNSHKAGVFFSDMMVWKKPSTLDVRLFYDRKESRSEEKKLFSFKFQETKMKDNQRNRQCKWWTVKNNRHLKHFQGGTKLKCWYRKCYSDLRRRIDISIKLFHKILTNDLDHLVDGHFDLYSRLSRNKSRYTQQTRTHS